MGVGVPLVRRHGHGPYGRRASPAEMLGQEGGSMSGPAGWNGHRTAVTVQFDAPVRLRVVERGEDLEIPGWPE